MVPYPLTAESDTGVNRHIIRIGLASSIFNAEVYPMFVHIRIIHQETAHRSISPAQRKQPRMHVSCKINIKAPERVKQSPALCNS